MLATHTPRAHAVPHPERGVHAVCFVALQRSSSETPGLMDHALQGTPGMPHPIGPSSSPLRPFGLVWGCSLACALTSWGLQAPARCGRLKKHRPNRRRLMLWYADPTQCAQCALSFFCRPGSRADSAPARLSRCALCRGAPQSEALPSLALRSQASAARKTLFASTSASSAQVPAPHSPMLQPTDDAEGLGFHVPS